jgi:hypothetical protein
VFLSFFLTISHPGKHAQRHTERVVATDLPPEKGKVVPSEPQPVPPPPPYLVSMLNEVE